ncbi:MAG: hypothetical protein LBE35_08105 [Clostridiales bacterium]|jgi:hypothetical protein|nr:hypothetical protein [Clostridiales bacterium]
MSEKEQVYEIMGLMNDNHLLRGDVNSAAHMIRNMLSDKYISPIQRAIEKENKRARKNPCKEARLLAALKPFVNTGNHKVLDDTIDALHLMETLQSLRSHMPKPQPAAQIRQQAASPNAKDPSIQPNGIYDMDEKCLIKKEQNPMNPIFMAILLSSFARAN